MTWCVAFAAALVLDAPVARWARTSGTAAAVRNTEWAERVKVPGGFGFTLAVVILLWNTRRVDWRRCLYVLAVAAFAGGNAVVKWVVGRTRPYKLPVPLDRQPAPFALHPFWHGVYGLFHETDLSFPSGHASTAAALAVGVLAVAGPVGWVFAAMAVAVGVERVLENAHYVSDVVAAFGWAVLGGRLGRAVLWRWVAAGRPRRFDLGPAGP